MREGIGDRTELQYIDPHSYDRQRCVFLVLQGCSTGGPEAHSAGWWLFFYCILSATSLDPNSSWAPRAPSAWRDFPYHISSITPSPTVTLFVLTELYNSSTSTQSPTRSLEWHIWSSSSGNNCHAVHRSLSSGASVYECTMGNLACPILLAKSTYAISPHKCHRNVSLPSSASLCNGKFGRVEGQNTTLADGLSLEFERQQASLCLQDFSL